MLREFIAQLPRSIYPERPYIERCIPNDDGETAQLYFMYHKWPHRTLKDIIYKSDSDLLLQLSELQNNPPLMYPIRPQDDCKDPKVWAFVKENFGIVRH